VTVPPNSLWALDNLVPLFTPIGTESFQRESDPRSRARLLRDLGFRRFAYAWAGTSPFLHWWRHASIPTLDEELDALREADIELFAAWFPYDPGDAQAGEMLAAFARHDVRPRLWVMQSMSAWPTTAEGWAALQAEGDTASRLYGSTFAHSDEEQQEKLAAETSRIRGLARMGAEHGCEVSLYNHHGWSGLTENQVAIIEKLASEGEPRVSIVYTFSHARDGYNDDTADFEPVWSRIRPHVDAINIGGTFHGGRVTYPGHFDRELEMMRVIEASGWTGPVAVKTIHGSQESLRETLTNSLRGIEWCARELAESGSGGPRPFPAIVEDGVPA
jgi:sugar phosphate isomerase/epimerase